MKELPVTAQRALLGLLAVLWTGGIVGGLAALNRYKSTPGKEGQVLQTWPSDSTLPRETNSPTLVVFAHPLCPCTRASMTELTRLLDRKGDRVRTLIVMMRPTSAGDEWARSSLVKTAQRLPNTKVLEDTDGREAERFGATTSGTAALYGRDGQLLFHGGLTIARGHEGDSPGVKQIADLLEDRRIANAGAPVFGCSLFTPELAR